MRQLSTIEYMPSLFLRPAEMQALSMLSKSEKDFIFPIFLLRPWMTSKLLDAAFAKLEETYGERTYLIDVDHLIEPSLEREAGRQFNALFDSNDGIRSWFSLIKARPNALPCLRLESASEAGVLAQAEIASDLGRPFALRLVYGRDEWWEQHLDDLLEIPHASFLIIIDLGWSIHLTQRFTWAEAVLKKVSQQRPDLSVNLSGSSFPWNFANFSLGHGVSIQERHIFEDARRRFNAINLIYGDWGSARPPLSTGGGKPVPRIDYPSSNLWHIYRCPDDKGGYQTAARKIMHDEEVWRRDVHAWGRVMIEATAEGEPSGITSPQKATATRINLHMHRQCADRMGGAGMAYEEDYEE